LTRRRHFPWDSTLQMRSNFHLQFHLALSPRRICSHCQREKRFVFRYTYDLIYSLMNVEHVVGTNIAFNNELNINYRTDITAGIAQSI
jgi:hypothetical protein